jgi:glucose-1-phosphate thymidylyltransferase
MRKRKGIILAGGTGSRLNPLTNVVSKQLLPIYNKPTIYYPLSTIMLTGIREILIVSTPEDTPNMMKLLGSGEQFGLKLSYKVQDEPKGLAEAYILAEDFLNGAPSMMVLGDNVFHSPDLARVLRDACACKESTIFGYHHPNPVAYGVVEFDDDGKVLTLEEKPEVPKSNFAIPGIYFFDSMAPAIAKNLHPSARGELEIIDMQLEYLRHDKLFALELPEDVVWWDTGSFDTLLTASVEIKNIEEQNDILVCSPEAIALENGWISKLKLRKRLKTQGTNSYNKYLENLSAK